MMLHRHQSREEDSFQIAVCDLLLVNRLLPVHTPNQGKRSAVVGWTLKRMGLRPGHPDLEVFDRPGGRGLLCKAELKRPPKRLKSGALSVAKVEPDADQLAEHEELRRRGVPVFVWRTIEEVVRDIEGLDVVLKVRG